MSRDEVLNHRKNKFLSIGRNKGFISQSESTHTLSMKQSFIDNLKGKIFENKKQFIILISILIFIASF